jgi:hypothetical protein
MENPNPLFVSPFVSVSDVNAAFRLAPTTGVDVTFGNGDQAFSFTLPVAAGVRDGSHLIVVRLVGDFMISITYTHLGVERTATVEESGAVDFFRHLLDRMASFDREHRRPLVYGALYVLSGLITIDVVDNSSSDDLFASGGFEEISA